MVIKQTVKRTVVRARKALDRWIGYGNFEEPYLSVTLEQGYTVDITYADLAHLVRAADKHAERVTGSNLTVQGHHLKDWRKIGSPVTG